MFDAACGEGPGGTYDRVAVTGTGGGVPSRWLRLVPVVVTLACLAPVVSSALHVLPGWVPVSDTAIIAIRSRDVLTDDAPLLGQPSTAGATVGEQVHHPGPLEYWAIGAAQRLGDHRAASLVVVAVVNGAAVLTVLWWLRALGGTWGLALGAVPVVATLWSLRGETLVDPLNPLAAVLPFAAFLVSLVASATGRPWALASAVVAGSWAAQAHVSVTGLVAAATLGVVVAAVASRLWRRARPSSAPPVTPAAGHAHGTGSRWRRPVVVALVLLLACWAGPIVDVLANGGGNVRALATTAGSVESQPRGSRAALDRTVGAVAWRPVWAQAGAGVPHLLRRPSTAEVVGVLALWLVGLVAAVANRRRAPALAWALTAVSVVLVTGTALLARLPGSFLNIFQAGNYLWLWPASALLWSAAAGGVVVLVGTATGRRPVPAGLVLLPLAVVTALAGASVVEPSHRAVQRDGPAYVTALSGQLAARLDRSSVYGVDLSFDLDTQVVDVGIVHELERRGFDLRVPEAFEPSFGSRRASGLAATDGTLVVDLDADAPPAGGTLVAAYRPPPELVDRLEAVERALAARVDRAGGPEALLYPALGIEPPATTLDFVRGDLLGLTQIGLLPATVAAWPELRALDRVRALPVREVAVHLVAPPAAATLSP